MFPRRERRVADLIVLALVLSGLSACDINKAPRLDEQVKAAWSEVLNQYQRRADLIPNLVETVKGYAHQEQQVLTQVTQARAKATQMQLPADILSNPQAFHEFEQNQAALGGALGRLLAVSERYPTLKSDQNFLALQSQLEGTENRIAVARRDYIIAVQHYNTALRTIPDRWVVAWMYPDLKVRENFHHHAASPTSAAGQVLMRPGHAINWLGQAGLSAFLLLLLAAPALASGPSFPRLTGRVVDDAHILSASTQGELTAMLARHERATGEQVVVVTLPSLQGYSIEEFGYQLGRDWGIGQKDKNTGALLIVAPKEHKVRIEVGYGLEGQLTDAQSRVIIERDIVPQFKRGDFDAGVLAGTATILKVLGGDTSAAQAPADSGGQTANVPTWIVVGALFAIWLMYVFLMDEFERDPRVIRRVGRSGYGGFYGGGFGGGSSGGSGFSGGGGSFGGGGASGSW